VAVDGEDGKGGDDKSGDSAAIDAAIAAAVEKATAGLKAKNTELLGRIQTLKPRADAIGDRTPEEVAADLELAAHTREARAKAEGDFESLKSQLVAQHNSEREKLAARTKKVEGKLFNVLGHSVAEAELAKRNVPAKLLMPHLLPHIRVVEDGDDFSVTIVDSKGNARISDASGSAMTIAQLVDEVLADPAFDSVVPANVSSGGGARNRSTSGGGGSVVVIPKDASPQEYRRLKGEAERRGVGYQVAQ